jgi:hypothetical protein
MKKVAEMLQLENIFNSKQLAQNFNQKLSSLEAISKVY